MAVSAAPCVERKKLMEESTDTVGSSPMLQHIAVQDEAAAVADQDSAAYVMKSLDFDGDTIIDTKYVLKGGTQTVTVKDGEWLELFAAVATPAE